ncbi:MAG: hypothetical protein LQ339_003916 [Xanthoria mediterranea]|nr:MAG: hypothetical protein LQ339_003916 [Xanthoria mediterranea]
MAFEHPRSFPTVPASLSAGDHGMHSYYATQDIPRDAPHTVPQITPYLGLRARLSQIWINRWTVLLFLILVRLLIAVADLDGGIGRAKSEALEACTSVESAASSMVSMPHYMSRGVNELAASGVEKAVRGLQSMLFMTITGVEELVVFFINMLTSTYLCLITLVVSGSLRAALKIIEDAEGFLNKTLGDIGRGVKKGIEGFSDDLNKFTGALNSVPQLFGGNGIPKLNVDGDLDKLDNLKLPASINQGLDKLNDSIPNFTEVQNFTNTALRFPFEQVKKLIKESLGVFEFNRSLLPIPQKEKLNFCSANNGITDFFDGVAVTLNIARRIFIGVLVVAAILVCIPMAYVEIRRWRKLKERAGVVRDHAKDPQDVVYTVTRPYTSNFGSKLASKAKASKKQDLIRWVVAYATTTPALLLLSLAVTGLVACLFQYILLKTLQKEVPKLAAEIGDFAGKVVDSLDNTSAQWALGTNKVISSTSKDINKDVFGWVNTTTDAMNHTLNVFIDETTKVLNKTFGGTILYDPVKEVFNCLIGLKVAGIQKGLTWVHDHAHIDFPLLANNTFSLGAAASLADDNKDPAHTSKAESFFADRETETTDKITRAIDKVVKHFQDGIRTEALISVSLLLLWFVNLFLGTGRALYLLAKRDKVRGEGAPTYAGDIPIGGASPMPRGPAPAYEPPARDEINHRNPFSDSASTRRGHERDDREGEWQDEKLGFAGLREPEVTVPTHTRRSEYATMEKNSI